MDSKVKLTFHRRSRITAIESELNSRRESCEQDLNRVMETRRILSGCPQRPPKTPKAPERLAKKRAALKHRL